MRPILVCLGAAAAACASPPPPARPLGVGDHLAAADRADRAAEHHDVAATEHATRAGKEALVCGDRVLSDQSTSGGERLVLAGPCWSAESQATARHRDEAARLRDDARRHRELASALAAAERGACAGMPPDELDHTPFAHREDVLVVTAELEGGRVRGARVLFRKVPGLTAAWLSGAIACHQARAAAFGFPTGYLGYCPAIVPGARVTVTEEPGGILVVLRADDEAAALAIYGRAEDLLAPAP